MDDSLRSALVHADTLVLSRLYADDLLVMNYRGVRSTKQMLLGAIGRGTLQFDTLRVHFAVSGLASGSGSQTTGWSRSWERTRDGA